MELDRTAAITIELIVYNGPFFVNIISLYESFAPLILGRIEMPFTNTRKTIHNAHIRNIIVLFSV